MIIKVTVFLIQIINYTLHLKPTTKCFIYYTLDQTNSCLIIYESTRSSKCNKMYLRLRGSTKYKCEACLITKKLFLFCLKSTVSHRLATPPYLLLIGIFCIYLIFFSGSSNSNPQGFFLYF